MAEETELEFDYCESCGEFSGGRKQWMFHNHSLPAREFFCMRCLKRMQSYAWIGFSLLLVIITGLFGVFFWLRR
jgi:hypothetical protein